MTTDIQLVTDALEGLEQRAVKRIDDLQAQVDHLSQKSAGVPAGWGRKSQAGDFVATLMADGGFKAFAAGNAPSFKATLDLSLKSFISNESGTPAEHDGVLAQATRWPAIIATPTRQARLSDLIPTLATSSASVEITREAAWSNGSASQQGEGAEKASSSIDFELLTSPVRTIASTIEVSQQVLSDQPALEAYLRGRLADGLVRELERQIVAGDGNSFSMTGLLDASNHVAYTASTGEDQLTSIRRARAQLLATDYAASAVILNPADAAEIDLLRDDNGGYLSGEPRGTDAASLWGLRVLESPAMPAGTFAVSDFASSAVIWDRQSTTVEAFVSADLAKRNLILMRAELRAAFSVLLPAGVRVGQFV